LTTLVDILEEKVKHTRKGPSIDEVLRDAEVSTTEEMPFVVEVYISEVSMVVSKFFGNNNTQQIGEVLGYMSTIGEVPRDTMVLYYGRPQ